MLKIGLCYFSVSVFCSYFTIIDIFSYYNNIYFEKWIKICPEGTQKSKRKGGLLIIIQFPFIFLLSNINISSNSKLN